MTDATWRDRLSGTTTASVASASLCGQLMLIEESPGLWVNSDPARGGDYLVPGTAGRWSIWEHNRRPLVGGDTLPHSIPDPITASSVLSIGRELIDLEGVATTIDRWIRTSPLVRSEDADDRLCLTPLEESMDEKLGHIRSVCWSPHDRLRVAQEVVPVQRARRTTAAAIAHLAAHSEYWRSRTVQGIRPNRVLARRYDEDIDLYENRVAARLVENLLVHVREHIAAVNDLARAGAEIDRYQNELKYRRSWRDAERLWELIAAHAENAGRQQSDAEVLIEWLRGFDRALTTLLGSRVLHGVNRKALIPLALRPTNLLSNDHRYRQVGALWRDWVRSRDGQRDLTDAAQRQEFCRAFERYVLLLVVRAAEYIHLRPAADGAPAPGTRLPLHGRQDGDYAIEWARDGTFAVRRDGVVLARFVPLAHALTAPESASEVSRALDDVGSAVSGNTIVVYPGRREERNKLPLRLRLRSHTLRPFDPATSARGQVGLIPVSPLEIDSIERLARALRWIIESPKLLGYPPRMPCPPSLAPALSEASGGWLTAAGPELRARRPPSPGEWTRTFDALRQRRSTSSKARQRGGNEKLIDRLGTSLEALRQQIELLLICPTCTTRGDIRAFDARDGETFHSTCGECKAEWGLRIGGKCGHRYPILWTGGQHHAGGDGDTVDRTIGNELLATPCWRAVPDPVDKDALDSLRRHYICSWCGICPGAHDTTGIPCDRCDAGDPFNP